MTSFAALHSLMPEAGVPQWVHLIPAGTFSGVDGRGPYHLKDPAAVIAASMPPGAKLPIDQDHATDLAAPQGGAAPARGWIIELEAREDGIWGRVEWTPTGREMIADGAYRGISPVMFCKKNGEVVSVRRASLTNNPNLAELATLHAEKSMSLKKSLASLLKMSEDVDDEELMKALKSKLHSADDEDDEKKKAAHAALVADLGLAADAGPAEIHAAVTALKGKNVDPAKVDPAKPAGDEDPRIAAMSAKIDALTSKLEGFVSTQSKQAAEAEVDVAIQARRITPAERGFYVEAMSRDPEGTRKAIAARPQLFGGPRVTPPDAKGGPVLDEVEMSMCAQMGLTPEAFHATKVAEQKGR